MTLETKTKTFKYQLVFCTSFGTQSDTCVFGNWILDCTITVCESASETPRDAGDPPRDASGIADNHVRTRLSPTAAYPEWFKATYELVIQTPEEGEEPINCKGELDIRSYADEYVADITRTLRTPAKKFTITITVIEHHQVLSFGFGDCHLHCFHTTVVRLRAVSSRPSDTVDLVVGERRIRVDRAYLASISTYFDALFNGDFVERDKDEIELKGMSYDQLKQFLGVVYPMPWPVFANNVTLLLHMADFFGCELARWMCANFLAQSETIPLFERLRLVDAHALRDAETRILRSVDASVIRASSAQERAALSVRLRLRLLEVLCGHFDEQEEEAGAFVPHNALRISATPTRLADAALVVGGMPICVNAYYLAVHSNYFKQQFYGEEPAKQPLVLEDLEYDAFVDFVSLIYPERKPLTPANLAAVIAIAQRFRCAFAMHLCEKFLRRDCTFSMYKRLEFADRYGLTFLEDELLRAMRGWNFGVALRYGRNRFSDRLKWKLCGWRVKSANK